MAGRQCGKEVSIARKVKEAGQGCFLKELETAQEEWGAPLVADLAQGSGVLGVQRTVTFNLASKPGCFWQ